MLDLQDLAVDDLDHLQRWKNLTFFRSGKSFLGCVVYDSANAALARHLEARARDIYRGYCWYETADGEDLVFPLEGYSHCIQVSWGGE